MTHSPSTSRLGVAYDPFLFAAIGDDSGAGPLNTVSVLARLDIDPWQEAAELTGLPRDSAVRRLAGLLARLPGRPYGLSDPETIAMRLVALLPVRTGGKAALHARIDDHPGAAMNSTFIAICFGFAIVVLLSGLLQATRDQSAAEAAAKPHLASSPHPLAAAQPNIRRQ